MSKDKLMSPEDIINMMKVQFGSAVKAYWFYDEESCPCCLANTTGEMMFDNKKAASINAFMFRERGAMIVYALCETCAKEILAKQPTEPTPMHASIEENLKSAYLRYLNSLA